MTGAELLRLAKARGFVVFEDPEESFNLNIIGHRTKYSRVNYFDDELIVIYGVAGIWRIERWPVTTLPGLPSLLKPQSPHGTAILCPGQYRSCYRIGLHRGKYEALIQYQPVKVYRDRNFDAAFDMFPEMTEVGNFGINIHNAGEFAQYVGPNSAGCQVFQYGIHFRDFMSICRLAALEWGNSFTYTLLEY